jgi:hypothetical protein
LIATLFSCFFPEVQSQEIGRLLPSPEKIPGWKIQQGPDLYAGDRLFDLIDGGADIYFEYGFSQVISVDYIDQAQNITEAEIYEMTDAPAAYGIFSLTQQAGLWGQDYGQLSAVNKDYIAFWKGRYYVIISWSSRQDPVKKPMETLARLISDEIEEDGPYPALLARFSVIDPGKKAVYLKGNLALSNFYYFDYKDIFETRDAIGCTPGDHHRLVFCYDDQVKALSVFAATKQSMIANKRFTDVAMIYHGYTCRDNKGNQILVRQEDRYIIVLVALVSGANLSVPLDEVIARIERQYSQ